MKNRFYNLLCCICIFLVSLVCCEFLIGGTGSLNGVEVLTSNEKEVIVSFSPELIRIDTVQIHTKKYGSIFFKGAVPFGKAGDPEIPCRILSLGVPPAGEVRFSILDAVVQGRIQARLIPISGMEKRDGMSANVFSEGEQYRKAGLEPSDVCRILDPEWFGVQRICRIFLFPVHFDPAQNTVELYSKIVVRVSFGAVPTVQGWIPAPENRFYQDAILNYPVAKKWQARQDPSKPTFEKIALSGTWYKMVLSQDGVYKVTGASLKTRGIDIASIKTTTLKVCNNGGRELPRSLSVVRPDSLIENPILMFGMEDGRFDESDYFLFYGKATAGWEYSTKDKLWSHYNNIYTAKNMYWLGFNDGISGRRIQTNGTSSNPSIVPLLKSIDRFFFEQDRYNPLRGGTAWLGYEFNSTSGLSNTVSIEINLPDLVPNDSVLIRLRFKGGEKDRYADHQFGIRFNDIALSNKQFYGEQFYPAMDALVGGGKSGKNTLVFSYSSRSAGANAFLDWIEIEYRRLMKASGGRLLFYSPSSIGTFAYALSDFSAEPLVLDVTRFSDIRKLPVRREGNSWIVTDEVEFGNPKQYFSAQESAFLSPEDIQRDNLSDLKNAKNRADLIIITHKDFFDQAQRLKSFKESHDTLATFVADIEDVYDEFSAGLLDPAAIRDFVRYSFNRWSKRPSFLLLFGDGNYDYRNILSANTKNWIPPFEYDELYQTVDTKASDDWFTYVAGDDSRMDLAVGRLPVQTKGQAATVVEKLIQYESKPDLGDWRTLVTVVGDDEKSANPDFDNEINHIQASEDIAEHIIPSVFNLRKIYLTDYPEEIQVEGRRKPKAREDLLDQINRGTLIVNYIGHANEDVWAHERIFYHETDLSALRNASRLPLFYAATCSFAWFDDPNKQSFGEDLVIAEGKGAIAVIAASRECISGPNEALDREFMRTVFNRFASVYRIGEALRLAKLNTFDTSNNETYNIMGDPTLRLAFPRYQAIFTDMHPDSFQALSVVSATGSIQDDRAAIASFQGKVLLKGFDSKKSVTYTTKWGTRLNYMHPGNSLFRGEAKAENGTFRLSFIVPKEITYGSQTGRLSAYFRNETETSDGLGAKDGIAVGGTANILDDSGPEIRLSFSDMEHFVSGGTIHEDPELVAMLRDEKTGINLTGEIGHTLSLSIDGQPGKNISEYFQYDEGSYLQGKLSYPLLGLSEGDHEIVVKAWDNSNNSSTQTLLFRIVPQDELRLEEVMNYPNPFSISTHFTFQLNQNAEIVIKIFTVEGRMIRKLEGFSGYPGFNMVPWDGLDDVGDTIANGVYLYRITVSMRLPDKTIEKSEIGRLLIMR